jgi:SAM-dependent methyltransferase
MNELSKSILRRLHDSNYVRRYFIGSGIDIGSGPDPLSNYYELFPMMGPVRAWDLEDGDAAFMESVPDESFDFVHSSHCLEHMTDPEVALKNWFRILRPNGHLVVLIPDEDMYEQGTFPSTFNSDHKWTLTVHKKRSWSPNSRNVLDLLLSLGERADIIKVEQATGTYRFGWPRFDQTLTPVGESAIEFVVRKRLNEELDAGGFTPAIRQLVYPSADSTDESESN